MADATRIVRTCQGCQFYARQTHLPAQALQTIPITWSFAVWGLDLVGPLQKAPGGYTHLLVAIDKFSKWIEVRPLNSIRSEQAVAFFTNIIHRFGVPNSIVTDNGTQFTSSMIRPKLTSVSWLPVDVGLTSLRYVLCSGTVKTTSLVG